MIGWRKKGGVKKPHGSCKMLKEKSKWGQATKHMPMLWKNTGMVEYRCKQSHPIPQSFLWLIWSNLVITVLAVSGIVKDWDTICKHLPSFWALAWPAYFFSIQYTKNEPSYTSMRTWPHSTCSSRSHSFLTNTNVLCVYFSLQSRQAGVS